MKKTVASDAAGGGLVTGLQVPETGYYWLYRPMSYAYLGKDAFYGRQGKDADPSWDSTDSVKTLSLFDQLTPLWSPGVLALGIDQADQAFAANKAAWDVGGTFPSRRSPPSVSMRRTSWCSPCRPRRAASSAR